MQRYPTWVKATAILQFSAAAIHAITLFISLPPANETENQLFTLMDSYKLDFGAGFHKTMGEMVFVLSACYCLLCLLAGLVNWYLLRKKVIATVLKGVITINLVVFGILLVLTAVYTFLLPIILSALIFLFLVFSQIALSRAIRNEVNSK